jgi:ABC-type branched-subunit amino acid transport system substrate-binding protein
VKLNRWSRRLAVPLSALLVAGGLGACGTGNDNNNNNGSSSSGSVTGGPGVDVAKKTINVTNISALTGPVGALGIPASSGTKTFIKALNTKGGIDGWKINYKTVDSAYDNARHIQKFNAVKSSTALLQSLGSPTTKAAQSLIDQENITTLPLSWDTVWAKDNVLVPVGTPYAVDIANIIDYLVKNQGAKSEKFGIIYQNDEYGADAKRGYDAAIKADGLNDAAQASFKAGDTDFTAQIAKLKKAGVQVLIISAVPSSTGPIVGTAASLSFAPTYVLQGPAWLELLMTKDGRVGSKATPIAGALAKDTYVASFAPAWGDKSAPLMSQMLADVARYKSNQEPTEYFTGGYAEGVVIEAILRKAIANGDLSRAGIHNAKDSLGTVDTGGLAPPPTYSTSTAITSRKTVITKVDPKVDGFLKPIATYEGTTQAQFK